jgi:hypothetical protein
MAVFVPHTRVILRIYTIIYHAIQLVNIKNREQIIRSRVSTLLPSGAEALPPGTEVDEMADTIIEPGKCMRKAVL